MPYSKKPKIYALSENREVIVRRNADKSYTVSILDKLSIKTVEFPEKRWASFVLHLNDIDESVQQRQLKDIKYFQHIGGGFYVSVTSAYKCVDIREFYMPSSGGEVKPTRRGIAIRLHEWETLKGIIERIAKDIPALATIQPCYQDGDHNAQNQEAWMHCHECLPFGLFA